MEGAWSCYLIALLLLILAEFAVDFSVAWLSFMLREWQQERAKELQTI
jgi:hypothetical protein